VILFDKRGTGLSDRVTHAADLETMMDDVRSVLDAVGAQRTVLWGDGLDGGGTCAVYAASFPDRVVAFIWWQAIAVEGSADPEYPWGYTAEESERCRMEIKQHWGGDSGAARLLRLVGGPSMADDPDWQRLYAKLCRYATTPGGAIALDAMWDGLDLRNILPSLRVPTLVVKRKKQDEPEGRYIASRIPGARLAVLSECDDFTPTLGDQDEVFGIVTSFLDSVRQEESEFDRILATVLFTDIVDSTMKAVELGDRRWKDLVEDHHARVRALLSRYRGREIDTAGDGFFASFDGPARAVRCGKALTESVRELGIEVRVGVHTGECELASQTVKDLVAGSGLVFEDAGEHELKGVPDRWRLYRVVG
jgi:pimeloyl-ACP methyl ester carboxylesterase